MNLIILPGNNWRNQEWTEEVERVVRVDFDKTWMQHYESWETHTPLLDPDKEVQKLALKAEGLGVYSVFAKSAGALLAMKAIQKGELHPVKCMFVGTAIAWGEKQKWPVEEWVRGYEIPTLFVQKTDDPIMSFADLKQRLEKWEVKNYKLAEIPGGSHHYEGIVELKRLLKEWVCT